MKVLAAMSGGVDSSVAAARALEAGHEVVGVHLALSRMPGTLRSGSRGCCTLEDSTDAWKVCEKLGIPYYVWDFSDRFYEEVVENFIDEYAAGRTPNPCMRCNERIKFAALLEKALALGFDAICTGHYARVVRTEEGDYELHRAGDWAKDQSYVLAMLTAAQLPHVLFPLAEVTSKAQVRAEAARRGFSVATKKDSHDICFIPEGNTRAWLSEKLPQQQGEILDEGGRRVGSHSGAFGFTIGQRRGLHVANPVGDGRRRFVIEVKPSSNTVVVGPQELLTVGTLHADRLSWAGAAPPQAQEGQLFTCTAQVRAHAEPVPARARATEGQLQVFLDEPIRGVAPGQTVVLYGGTRVLGQAIIHRTAAAASLTTPG